MSTEFPRRMRLDLNTPAELAIYNAMQEVEKAGADLRLTQASTLLSRAKDFVSDFVDGVKPLLNSETEKVAFDKWKDLNKFWQDKDIAGIVGDWLWRSSIKTGVYTDDDLRTLFYKEFFDGTFKM
jgi:hypothetical protein